MPHKKKKRRCHGQTEGIGLAKGDTMQSKVHRSPIIIIIIIIITITPVTILAVIIQKIIRHRMRGNCENFLGNTDQ